MENSCAVILAAGDGTRMRSRHPKVMCEVLFKPLVRWVAESCRAAGVEDACVVLGAGAEEVCTVLPEQFQTVTQDQRLGTGHAASMAQDFLRQGGFSHVLVVNGDAPFLSGADLRAAWEQHTRDGNLVTVVTARVGEPYGYGRILRDGERVLGIVEEKDASEEQKKIDEINSGAFWFDAALLLESFAHMTTDNAQGEYYITQALTYALQKGGRAGAYIAGREAVLGANSRAELARLNEIARRRVLDRLMDAGVNIPFPADVVIGPDVAIGPDTTILPGTILRGNTEIGAECEIGPNSYLQDALLGDRCRVISSYIESSTVQEGVKIGPMSNVRPGCLLRAGCKIGDFVELKNSEIGEGTAVAHLTYVGDSDVGARCNFGCGVVTVNYDGSKKYRTVIGDDAFIGCNTNLVAPVTVGNRVYAAAGTTITDDVPSDALVIGRARQVVKENWVQERGRYNKHTGGKKP